jgi:lipopolysaccharide export system permease protein
MQFLWKYIDDLVGKGLEMTVILQLLYYASASLVIMALPLAALLSGMMTMGNMAESNELMASKSTGISMVRIFRPVLVVVVLLSLSAFFFANNVLPKANLKFQTLFFDIKSKKLALDIRPGVFYDGIDGYRIRIGDKSNNTNEIQDVLIYDHTTGIGNNIVIKAERGNMFLSPDTRWLFLKLYNGNRYEELSGQGNEYKNNPSSRVHFKEYEIKFDLSSFQFNRTNSTLFKGGYKMLNMSQLEQSIDSVGDIINNVVPLTKKYLEPYFYYLRDTTFFTQTANNIGFKEESFINNFPEKRKEDLLTRALLISRNIKQVIESPAIEVNNHRRALVAYYVEWHRKLMIAFTVFSLFLIGAPLGAIIRKGGLGLPAVISTVLFVLYYIVSLIGEKLAKQVIITPFWGMWMPVFIMMPIGMFLIYKANQDSKIFTTEGYNWFLNWIRDKIPLKIKFKLQKND